MWLKDITSFWALLILLLTFSVFRYLFASGTAYVTAMIAIYATLVQSVNGLDTAQAMLILLLPMGFMGIITPYGTGCSPLWYGSHYIKSGEFFKLGAIFAAIYMVIYCIVGIPWVEFISPYLTFHIAS